MKWAIDNTIFGLTLLIATIGFSSTSKAIDYRNATRQMDSLFIVDGRNNPKIKKLAKQLIENIENIDQDTLAGKVWMYQAFIFPITQSDSIFYALEKALALFKKEANYNLVGQCHYHLGYYNGRIGNFPTKQKHLQLAIDNFSKARNHPPPKYWFNAHNALASVSKDMALLPEALEAAIKAREIGYSLDNPIYILRAALNLGAIYGNLSLENFGYTDPRQRQKYKELVLKYTLEEYTKSKEVNAEKYIMISSYNLGLFYSENKDWEISNGYLEESYQLAKKLDSCSEVFYALEIKGDNLLDSGKSSEATDVFKEAYRTAKNCASIDTRVRGINLYGRNLLQNREIKKAINVLHEGLQLAEKHNLDRRKQTSYKFLYSAYKMAKQYEKALLYNEKWNDLSREMVDQDALSELQKLQAKFEKLENERKISILEKIQSEQRIAFQKKIYWTLGIGLSLLFGFILYTFRNRNILLENQKKAAVLEQKLLRSQMNPHFTFNTLSSIQKYLLREGQAKEGAYFLAKFAKLIRHILDQSNKPCISLKEEIKSITNYLELQKLRFNHAFQFEINVNPKISQETCFIPPMLIQPTLENAIEHGKIYARENGKVLLSIDQKDQRLRISIIDNGLGINKTISKPRAEHKSIALNIIRERIDYLKQKDKKVDFRILSNLEEGTEVIFLLPILDKTGQIKTFYL